MYHWWVPTADPVLGVNPIWAKFLAAVSPILYLPFYVIAIRAFWKGSNWIRVPCLIWASLMIFTIALIASEQYWGIWKCPNWGIWFSGYGPYALFPFLLIYRVRNHKPFSTVKKKVIKSNSNSIIFYITYNNIVCCV